MGILLEADYKGVISGKEPIVKGLQRAFSPTKFGTQNPLERKRSEDLKPQEKDGQLTYEVMNRDSGAHTHLGCSILTDWTKQSHWHKKQPPKTSPLLSISLLLPAPLYYQRDTSIQNVMLNLLLPQISLACETFSSGQAFCMILHVRLPSQ